MVDDIDDLFSYVFEVFFEFIHREGELFLSDSEHVCFLSFEFLFFFVELLLTLTTRFLEYLLLFADTLEIEFTIVDVDGIVSVVAFDFLSQIHV